MTLTEPKRESGAERDAAVCRPGPLAAPRRIQFSSPASNPVAAILWTRQLRKSFSAGGATLEILRGIDLALQPGELVAVVGESGCGKSTLLHVLSTLDSASSGEIYFAPRGTMADHRANPDAARREAPGAPSAMAPAATPAPICLSRLGAEALAEFRNREIGYVWQMHHLLPEFTLLENVMLPRLIAGETPARAAAAARDDLASVGLAGRAHHRAGELSGGEQQRGALARALTLSPRLLLADEPTGNLDEATGERVFDLLARLHRERGLTTLLATHNAQFARRCDRVLRLHLGQLAPLAPAGPSASPVSG